MHVKGKVTSAELTVSAWFTPDTSGSGFDRQPMESSLQIFGVLDKPLRGKRQFRLDVYPSTTHELHADGERPVGFWTRTTPQLEGAVHMSPMDLTCLVQFAAAGRLAWCDLTCTEPRYGSGQIFTAFFRSVASAA